MAGVKSAGLVREYLEKVSGSLLEDQYRKVISEMIRGHAGIYALYKGDKLYYVGLATNLMSRVKQHLKDRHARRWDRFSKRSPGKRSAPGAFRHVSIEPRVRPSALPGLRCCPVQPPFHR